MPPPESCDPRREPSFTIKLSVFRRELSCANRRPGHLAHRRGTDVLEAASIISADLSAASNASSAAASDRIRSISNAKLRRASNSKNFASPQFEPQRQPQQCRRIAREDGRLGPSSIKEATTAGMLRGAAAAGDAAPPA